MTLPGRQKLMDNLHFKVANLLISKAGNKYPIKSNCLETLGKHLVNESCPPALK